MQFRFLMISSLIIVTLIACDSKERVKAPEQGQPMTASPKMASSGHEVIVAEVLQAKSYTYLRVTEGSQEYWIATSKQLFEVGQALSYGQGLEMKNFTSKELGKDFESIWFIGQMNGATGMGQSMNASFPQGKELVAEDQNLKLDKIVGGVSIQDLYGDMSSYGDKTVSIRGEVTKFSPQIMGRNWVHLQDGTSANGKFDLTVTTMNPVKVGDIVVFKGVITLNKDFGAGYKYELIMEEAVLVNEG